VQSGAAMGTVLRWETWVMFPTFERKFAYMPAVTGATGTNNLPVWWADYMMRFNVFDPGGAANGTRLSPTYLSAPFLGGDIVYPSIAQGPTAFVTSPLTILDAIAQTQLVWNGVLDLRFAWTARVSQVGNFDFVLWSPTQGPQSPALLQDVFAGASGLSLFYMIPEFRVFNGLLHNSNKNYLWGQRSVSELRPRVYTLSGVTTLNAANHIVVDDTTLDAFLNSGGIIQNSNPTICPGLEGVIMTINGTFEGETPNFFIWVSCDGTQWRLLRARAKNATAQTILNGAGASLMHLDPVGNYWFMNAGSATLPLTSFGLTLTIPRRILPVVPSLDVPCTPIRECCP
jgi:hypothetical protein